MVTDFTEGYQHIGIPTDNMAATENFYRSLGFSLKMETVYEGHVVKFFSCGPVLIETYEREIPSAGKAGAVDHVALNCVNISSAWKELKKGNFSITEGPAYLPYWEHGVVFIVIEGPSRERVEFIQQFSSEEEKMRQMKALGL